MKSKMANNMIQILKTNLNSFTRLLREYLSKIVVLAPLGLVMMVKISLLKDNQIKAFQLIQEKSWKNVINYKRCQMRLITLPLNRYARLIF